MKRHAFAAVLMSLGLALPVSAQPGSGTFRDYPINFAPAGDVQQLLQAQLNQFHLPGQIVVDQQQNRLLVQGDERVQRIVQQYLLTASQVTGGAPQQQALPQQTTPQQSMPQQQGPNHPINQPAGLQPAPYGFDAAARGAQQDQARTGSMTQSYAVPADMLEVCANLLRQQYALNPDVRIATIPEKSHLIVVAPGEIQQQIGPAVQQMIGQPQETRQRYGDHLQQYVNQFETMVPGSRTPANQAEQQRNGQLLNQSYQYVPRNGNPQGRTLGQLGMQTDQGLGVELHAHPDLLIRALRQGLGDRFSEHPFQGQSRGAIFSINLGEEYGTVRLDWNLDTNKVIVRGYSDMQERMARALTMLDNQQNLERGEVRIMSLEKANPKTVLQLIQTVQRDQADTSSLPAGSAMVGNLFYRRQPQDQGAPQTPPAQPGTQPGQSLFQPTPLVGNNPQRPVRAEVIEGIGVVLTGSDQDLQQLMALIDQIIRESELAEPILETYPLRYVDSVQLGQVVQDIYDQNYSVRRGPVTLTPFANPNSLLIIGQAGAVEQARELIRRLDQPGRPDAQFKVFPLKHANALTVANAITTLYPQGGQNQGSLEPQVVVIADDRSNTLVVRGSQRDLQAVESLINELDIDDIQLVLETRVFQLRNSQAVDLIQVLQQIIIGGGAQQAGGGGFGGQQAPGVGIGQTPASILIRQFDAQGRTVGEPIRSGILSDVRLTADPRGNTLVVAAPVESMPLIAALIETLDSVAFTEAQIKVFKVLNGDASSLVDMLRTLFGQQTQQGGGGFGGNQQTTVVSPSGEGVVPLRFSVDIRTNSILVAGSANDLQIVEAILTKLDLDNVADRATFLVKLKSVPADAIANAITQMLQTEADLQGQNQTVFQQLQRQVVVVPEAITNSLIITTTPQYREAIEDLIANLDQDPPMVMIQVLIAEVTLNNTDEFGVELGLQDSILFDRSLLGDLVTTTNSIQTNNGGAIVTNTQQIIQGASNTPGFAFGNPTTPLGNSGSDLARSSAGNVAGQGLTSFSVGRINNELGYGGLVLSASSESVSVLLRALQESRRLDVISRPQIQTLDNQPAFVQVGQRVQLPSGSTFDAQTGVTTLQVGTPENVGIILGVVPRINLGARDTLTDDMVYMQIDVEKSEVGPETEGIPLSISPQGDVIRSPRINTVTAQTTISGADGQTVVLGGLLTKTENKIHRRVPLLASVPVLGHLFRYDLKSIRKTELMIILTPRIVRSPAEAEYLKRVESARMSWVLADITKMHGEAGLQSRYQPFGDPACTVYPDLNPDGYLQPVMPDGTFPAEGVPTPAGGLQDSQLGPGSLEQAPGPPQNNFLNFQAPETGIQQTSYYPPGTNNMQQQYMPQQGQAYQGGQGYRGLQGPLPRMEQTGDPMYLPREYNVQYYQQSGPQPPPQAKPYGFAQPNVAPSSQPRTATNGSTYR